MRRPRCAGRGLRTLILLLAAIDLVLGAYALFVPHGFYRDVLGVDLLGPYDEHLVTDIGGFYLGFALLFLWAARTLERQLLRAACAAFLLTQLLHFGYHALHLDHFSFGQGAEQTVSLAVLVLLPAVGLALSARSDGAG
jgi:hypothetical protein